MITPSMFWKISIQYDVQLTYLELIIALPMSYVHAQLFAFTDMVPEAIGGCRFCMKFVSLGEKK